MPVESSSAHENSERNSGIELLKIIALFLIGVSHVVNTLRIAGVHIPYNEFVVDISIAATDVKHFILMLFSYFGVLGNNIFFISSAWFLLRSSKYNKRKWFFMFLEIWLISIIILILTLINRHGNISPDIILYSIFPTTFSNNWYLTCYLLFYPIHPLLNMVINKLNRQDLFRISAAMFLLYFCLNFIIGGLFFASTIILWITIYFVMAYFQLYLKDSVNSIKCNVILLIVGFTGYIGIAFLANYLGLRIPALNNEVLHWASFYNPFLLAISLAMFNLMRKIVFRNKVINYISSLSLLIYIIHENIILRTYYRPAMWNFVYQNYGYDHIIMWAFVLTIIVLMISFVISVIYDKTIRPCIKRIADSLYSSIRNIYLKLEAAVLKLH